MNSTTTTLLRPSLFLLHHNPTSSTKLICSSSSSRNQSFIPKLQPFSRTKLDRLAKDLPLIEKSEKDLLDYCSILEGDESYSCWQAYFELKDLQKESPRAEIERLIIEIGGVKSLIGCLHGIALMRKLKKNDLNLTNEIYSEEEQNPCPRPDGLPKSADEMMEEEQAKMPDSSYTKLLRSMGKSPAWYSEAPDHETD
ncbi:hypothetical protein MtrunA17_Chr4g0045491 [Medicago truncatula]|uniref:Maternal effect embryo arrest protein, putative n=1 Tax=Medicago truncatula TaxID=3880 RepID=G7JNK2_MEDTR|nr:CCG-binding protein 1 isoform X1 [Medicago truncatula]AES90249.1 maternal effect embryo arrest protein, putative [Medicago truncatula]RHN62260.1 hypothetical protein MtrunA17_Chr4g0045491 [Medicago truncatula]